MTEVSQRTRQEPGPYPRGGEEIWERFLYQFFGDEGTGDPGSQQLHQGQTDHLMNALDQYVQDRNRGFNLYNQRMQDIEPTQVSLGGQPVTSFLPQPQQQYAGRLYEARADTAGDLLNARRSITPQQGQLENLNLLSQLANNVQSWRYRTPTQTTQGERDQGTVGNIADWVKVGTSSLNLLDELSTGGNFVSDIFSSFF